MDVITENVLIYYRIYGPLTVVEAQKAMRITFKQASDSTEALYESGFLSKVSNSDGHFEFDASPRGTVRFRSIIKKRKHDEKKRAKQAQVKE